MAAADTSPWLTRVPDTRRYQALAGDARADVCVVGGGIAGVAAAYALASAGRRVVLLEANHLGTGETGFTTAFLTSSVDPPLSLLRAQFGDDHLRRVRTLGEEAIAWVEQVAATQGIACGFHRVDAFALGFAPGAADHLAREAEALRVAGGTPVTLSAAEATAATGIGVAGAVRIPTQGVFDSRAFLLALAERVQQRGGQIFEETRMTGIEAGSAVRVATASGMVTAEHVVLATGLLPRPYQAQNTRFRQTVTYVIAFPLADRSHGGTLPDALYWDGESPFHYMRFVNGLFFVGGGDRPLKESTKAGAVPWEELERFARGILPRQEEITHRWRGQILETADALPLVGAPPDGHPNVSVLSGFGGNGMTLGVRSALVVADLIAGKLTAQENPFRFERETLTSPPSS